jgi:hypothetical protein
VVGALEHIEQALIALREIFKGEAHPQIAAVLEHRSVRSLSKIDRLASPIDSARRS